jgi:CheY-like chemotaxis protein
MAGSTLRDVRDIVEWLRQTEQRVGRLYARAADACREDPSFAGFLRGLSEDEQSHASFMSSALQQLHDAGHRPAIDILLDEQTRSTVEDLLDRFDRLLNRTTVQKKSIIEYVARAEASELNPIFLYVAEQYRRTGREGERMAGEVERHLRHIQAFIDDLGPGLRPSVNIGTLPAVGEDRFLVVEDHGPLRKLMASLLARRGTVDTASEGAEGLEKLRAHFHTCVVTDLRTPGIDGREFYRRAVEYDPYLKDRFLFCSSDVTLGDEDYIGKQGLPLLRKPFGLDEFHTAINRILRHDSASREGPSN